MNQRFVTFHSGGRTYRWDKASRTVFDQSALVAARDCYNLEQARKKVKK